MSSNTNIGNTPVNQGYVQLIHTGETGGIDGTLRTLYDGDGTAADLLIASDKVKVSTELFIGAKTLTEFIQDTVGTMFTTGNSLTNVSVTYDDANNNIDLNATGEVTLTGSQTLTNKTLTSPVINTSVSGTAILDEDNMSSNSDSKLATQQSIKAYVDAEVSSLVSSAPTALDTLDELAAALGDDANFATTTATSLGEKLVKASNLSDLTNTTTARSNLGLGSLATANNISVSNFNDAALQTSSESFADNDTSVMTSAAIQDKIESFGYTTNTGDMTGVSITASNPLDISQSNTTSGSYSATISLVASEFGGYLADMTDLVVGGTDELAVLDNGTLKRKQIDEIRLTAFDATGFSSGISFDGSTANGVLTFKDSDEATVEANLTFNGHTLTVSGDNANGINMAADGSNTNNSERIFFTGSSTSCIFQQGADLSFRTGATAGSSSGTERVSINTNGMQIHSGSLGVGVGANSNDGRITTSSHIRANNGTGGCSLTANDGGGNASITFNHESQVPEQDGNSARIHVNTDSSSDCHIEFEVASNVTASSSVSTTDVCQMRDGSIDIQQNLRHLGDTNTLMEFGTDTISFDTGGTEALRINSSQNVGIGETSIDANLHITGSPAVIKMERAGVRAIRFGIPSNSGKFIIADTDDLQSSTAVEIDSSRDVKFVESVGIGVTPSGTAGRLDCSNDVVAFASSDKRLKENIKPLDNALDKINKINGVEFDWKKLTEKEKETIHGNTGHDVGVIAQEIEEVLPEVVQTRENGYKAVKYEKIVPLLIEAIKELKQEIEELK